MILLKCVGAGALVAGAILASRVYKKELYEHERLPCALEQALRFLEGRIALSEKMLSDVMKECSERFFEENQDNVFGEFSKRLARGEELGKAWRESVETMKYADGTEPIKEKECLLRLETAFSLSDVERYSGSFIQAADEMKSLWLQAEKKRHKDGDTAMKLGLCFALAAVLVLW